MDKYLYYKDFLTKYSNYLKDYFRNPEIGFSDEVIHELSEDQENWKNRYDEWYNGGKKGMITATYREALHDIIEGFPRFLIENRQYFLDTYGVDLLELKQKQKKQIAQIQERGKIKTDNEYRLIDDYVDELCQTDGDAELIDKLNSLLFEYENLIEARLSKRKNNTNKENKK